ncbi:peptidase M48 [Actibacterium mucosum KCTC 23349]|uniref:Peptidase M48 n=1 Tax=Actibacterium mucosum KCTC 23349 TaxID=1454373 RepID=A0A037ZI42_9RHOB|nr:M48 family metalloprotease [Actibacterium mucosum]KAJ54460.1 peptidase M48 [Actibacterium mucosum KCTC 23349]
MAKLLRVLVMGFALTVLASLPARAQGLIRDAEIEYALGQLLAPLANAAGLGNGRIKVIMVNDRSLNAFVADGRTIFIHTGLLLKLKTADQVQAVLAHELAHIANGHITRRISNLRNARQSAIAGLVAAIAVGASGNTAAAAGLAVGAESASTRAFLTHTRAEEAAADQTAARYMVAAGVPPRAMVEVLELFRGQEALSGSSRVDPYVLTHPLTRNRLRAVIGFANAYEDDVVPQDNGSDYWFARAQGKLSAFLNSSSYTLRRVKKNDNSDVALIRKAVAYHRRPDAKAALREIDKLVAKRPNDPYVHELRGQILLESRNAKAAVSAYARAVNLAGHEALIRAGYGRALLALNTADGNRKALSALESARGRDPYDPRMLRDLAVAYARAGNNGMASVVTAERYALTGRLKDAVVHAKRAEGLLPRGSRGWLRAQDILAVAASSSRKK